MKITKCVNGHYYDLDKSQTCPFCNMEKAEPAQLTVAYNNSLLSEEQSRANELTQRYFENVKDSDKTINYAFVETQINPVAGWLVCEEGEDRGRFFALYGGKNFLGTSKRMDITLSDKSVSKENHCAIIYDDKHIKFYLVEMDGSVFLNNEKVCPNKEIVNNDEIVVGESKLRFIQYCTLERNWNEKNN